MTFRITPILLALLLVATSAQAQYTLTAEVDGASAATMAPGSSFQVDFVMSGTGSNTSVWFDAIFSRTGLEFWPTCVLILLTTGSISAP